MNAVTIVAAIARIFAVLLGRKASVEASLVALAKRGARKGLPVLAWSWGRPVTANELLSHEGAAYLPGALIHSTHSHGVTYSVPVTRIPLTIEGETPRYAGWTFVACLQHLEGENIVRALPGEEIPESFRTRGPACDHCKANRRRNDTYVLRHDSGQFVQVGSTCIADFLGSDAAGKVASQAELFAAACALGLDDGYEGFGSTSNDRLLSAFLPIVAWSVRAQGWTSRTKAREVGGEATADRAWSYLTDAREARKAGVDVTDEDRATAEAAEAWGESLTDATVNAEQGDYLHNLRAVTRTGLVTSRTAGLAASVVTAYQRSVDRDREKAERAARPTLDAYQGNVGDKVSFGLAPKVGKRGAPVKGAPVVLSLAPVTLDFVKQIETQFGLTTIVKFRTSEGAVLTWFASSTELGRADVGKCYTLTGTVKAHKLYEGTKQTTMTRCTVTEAPAPSLSSEPPAPIVPVVDDYENAIG
jgi:hypothetical protein